MEEIKDEADLDAFFDEVDAVNSANRGKHNKLAFIISSKKPTLLSSTAHSSRSKLADLQLPTFDGKITEWLGFWECFQSQVGSSPELPKSAKFTYLLGQLRGEALETVKGINPSEQNYSVLEKTLEENFGRPRRIIRAHVMTLLKMPKPTLLATSLRQFYNAVMGDIRSLEALKGDVTACAPIIVRILEGKLPGKVRSTIEDCGKGTKFSLTLFTDSLKEYIAREEQSHTVNLLNDAQPPSRYDTYVPHVTSTLFTTVQTRCYLCKGTHASSQCTMPASEKTVAVLRFNLCLNCLNTGHRVSNCNAKGRCAKCKGKHHTSIHGIRIHPTIPNANPQRPMPTSSHLPSRTNVNTSIVTHDASIGSSVPDTGPVYDSHSQSVTTNCAPVLDKYANTIQSHAPLPITHKSSSSELFNTTLSSNDQRKSLQAKDNVVLLRTAKAIVLVNDKTLPANILFDEGSQRSYIRADFAKQLGLQPDSYKFLSISSFGGAVTKQNYCVSTIGLKTPSGIELVKGLISDEIVQPLNQGSYSYLRSDPHFQDIDLANDFNDENFVVDVLLGAGAAYRFLGPVDPRFIKPLIQTSKFGSIVFGPIPNTISARNNSADTQESRSLHTATTDSITAFKANSQESSTSSLSIENLIDNATLSLQLYRILQNQYVNYDVDEQRANHFIQNYQQQVDLREGQYFAPVPWKADHPPLPSNLEICKSRLTQVTSRVNKLGLMDQYCKVMAKHLAKGYIEDLSDIKQPWPEQGCHYLPHFFVLKDSEMTPLRIVFAANTGNVSLIDCLFTGPCLVNNLVELLIRFRFPHYAFVADIQRAFSAYQST